MGWWCVCFLGGRFLPGEVRLKLSILASLNVLRNSDKNFQEKENVAGDALRSKTTNIFN